MFTYDSLKNDLVRAGIRPTDTILVHSAMKSIGEVDGGADTVLDVLCDYVGKGGGLVVFPTLTYTLADFYVDGSELCRFCTESNKASYCLARGYSTREELRIFDIERTPSIVGLLTNLFRKRPGVLRSLHPSHSVAAFGKDAAEFVAGHENCASACAVDSPWHRLLERSAKMLMLGAHVYNTTFMHGVTEWTLGVENTKFYPCPFELRGYNGKVMKDVRMKTTVGVSSKFPVLEAEFESAGALKRFQFGAADSILMDCRGVAEITASALKKNPKLFT